MSPEYVITKHCKHRHRNCGKCGFELKMGKKYSLHPTDLDTDGFPVAYHAECLKQQQRKHTGKKPSRG
jgi:hypothetical protein